MRVTSELGVTWYEGDDGRKACVSPSGMGYMVHAHWSRDGVNWIGGYGEGKPVTKDEAIDLAERFVAGQPVPEELGGSEDNKPLIGGQKEGSK
jgi:hypothetical protein